MVVPRRTLKVLAALVWHIGGGVLVWKGGSLIAEAEMLRPDLYWHWLAIPLALLVGGVKAKCVFMKSCHKNLARIAGLVNPRVWQFFTLRFFILLGLMIAAGATLSRMARGQYTFLWAVATIDLSIAVALLSSGFIFWREWADTIQTHRRAV